MVKNVLIVKNSTLEGPGLIEYVLMENDICWDIIDIESGDKFPPLKNYNAIFVLGGPDSVNDKTPRIYEELKKISQAADLGIPFMGICLGMQLLVKANGGKVTKYNRSEIGWRDSDDNYFEVTLTNEGRIDPLFNGIEGPIKIFHFHNEMVRLNKDMKLLGTGKYCKNQIVKIGSKAYGIQGHIELTKTILGDWVNHILDLEYVNKDFILEDYNNLKSKYENTGRMIFKNFLRISELI
jgi:GMP synthase-like glutamine amidotransferase